MNIKDLEYFYQLSQLQSFTKVAEKFQITQPTVSYSVKRLEEQFNCQLVVKDPSHRTFALTNQGQILTKHIERLLPELVSAQKEINRSLAHYSAVGFPPIIINYLISLLGETSDELSILETVRPIRGGSVELLEQLLNGDLDLSLIGTLEPFHHNLLETKELFCKDLYLIFSDEHPLAQQKSLSFADVIGENFILLDEHNIHLKAFEQLNQKHHNQAKIFFKSDDISLIKQMLKHNMGISLLTDISLTEENSQLIKIPLIEQDRMSFFVNYALLKSATLSPEVTRLIDLFSKLGQEVK